MKSLRIAALGVAILASTTTVAGAQAPSALQQQGGQAGSGRGGVGRTLTGIELTDAQKAKIVEITAKYQPEMQALRDAMQSGDRDAGMQKMQALRSKMSPEVRAILTADQQAVYDKNIAEQKARMDQMRAGGGPGR